MNRLARFALLIGLCGATALPIAAKPLATWSFSASPTPAEAADAPTTTATFHGDASHEDLGGGDMFILARQFGNRSPRIDAIATDPLRLASISFSTEHDTDHLLTRPPYRTQVQINTGAGFVDVGAPIVLSETFARAPVHIDLGGYTIPAGHFSVRLSGFGFPAGGPHTLGDYFAMDDVVVMSINGANMPTLEVAMLLGLSLLVGGLSAAATWGTRRSLARLPGRSPQVVSPACRPARPAGRMNAPAPVRGVSPPGSAGSTAPSRPPQWAGWHR